jgi:pimeloyl-ACP methyl ester carboxylesterase
MLRKALAAIPASERPLGGDFHDAVRALFDHGNIVALVGAPAVADTHNIDRPKAALESTATRTARRQRYQGGERLVAFADRLAITLVALAVLLPLVRRTGRTRAVLTLWLRVRRAFQPPAVAARPSSEDDRHDHRPWLWTAAVLVAAAPVVITLCFTLWHSPFAINRNFGASDGEPRQEIDPIQQIRDYRHAITFARTLSEADRERIGVWGTSYSGGHALVVGAIDRRVKCVVSQVPTISGSTAALRRLRADLVPNLLATFDTDRVARFAGEEPAKIPVVAEHEGTPCALPGQDAWNFFSQSSDRAPSYRNEITLRSAEMAREYEPGVYVPTISPTPLLMIVATEDWVTPADLALNAFESALQPKKLLLLPGGHFVPYVDRFDEASGAAAAWFREHLIAV